MPALNKKLSLTLLIAGLACIAIWSHARRSVTPTVPDQYSPMVYAAAIALQQHRTKAD